jgi:predicted nucleic acid-binding Zn ribbon protein
MKNRKIERCNSKRYHVKYMNKKGLCKNCGEDINDDNNSNDFCSEQCGVEYQMEHNRK